MAGPVFAAFISVALSSAGPCGLATLGEVERVLGAAAVDVPVDEIGEETAPYCRWATVGRRRELKLEIWSDAELPVLGMPDAESYFLGLEGEAQKGGGFVALDGLGVRAFDGDGAIVMLKDRRVIVLDYQGVSADWARWLAAQIAPRL